MKLLLPLISFILLHVPGNLVADEAQTAKLHPDTFVKRSYTPTIAQIIMSRSTGRPLPVPQQPDLAPEPVPPTGLPTPPAPQKEDTLQRRFPGLQPDILERLEKYDPLVNRYSRLNAIDPNLTRAVIYVESAGEPYAVSSEGAMGLMQLMPATANDMGVKNAYDPAQNIFGGTRYLSRMIERFGSLDLALWAYNAGPESVKRKRLPLETRRYIPSVIRVKRQLDGGGY